MDTPGVQFQRAQYVRLHGNHDHVLDQIFTEIMQRMRIDQFLHDVANQVCESSSSDHGI